MSQVECPVQFVGKVVCGRQQQTRLSYEKNYGVSIVVPKETVCGHKTISIDGRRSMEVANLLRDHIARLQYNANKTASWKRSQREHAKYLRGPKVPDYKKHEVKVASTVNPFAAFDLDDGVESEQLDSGKVDFTKLFYIQGTENTPTIRELKRRNWEQKMAREAEAAEAENQYPNTDDDWYIPSDQNRDYGETEIISGQSWADTMA